MRPIDGCFNNFLQNLSYLTLKDFQENKAGMNTLKTAVESQPTLPQPGNEPLTLEELREMDGEPAFVPETNCWVLVTKNSFVPLFTFPDGEKCSVYDWYEHVGPVYRRPPEGKEDT